MTSTVLNSYEKGIAGCYMGAYAFFAGSGQIQVASAFEEPAAGTIGYEIYDFMGNAIGVCIALGISGYCDS